MVVLPEHCTQRLNSHKQCTPTHVFTVFGCFRLPEAPELNLLRHFPPLVRLGVQQNIFFSRFDPKFAQNCHIWDIFGHFGEEKIFDFLTKNRFFRLPEAPELILLRHFPPLVRLGVQIFFFRVLTQNSCKTVIFGAYVDTLV